MDAIVTGEVRFSFLNVFQPRANQEGQEPKYSATLLIPKSDTATYNKITEAINTTLQEGAAKTFGGQMPAKPGIPLYDGDGFRPNGEPFGPECKGHWVITASSKQKPDVVDENVQPLLSMDDLKSGDFGRVSIRFFAYNKAGKKGVGCGLGNVQKLRTGEGLGGRTSAADDFGAPQQPVQQYKQPQQAVDPITGMPINPITGQAYTPVGDVMGL